MPLHGAYDTSTFPAVEAARALLGRPFTARDIDELSAMLYTASIRYIAAYSGPVEQMKEYRKLYHTKWGRRPPSPAAAAILNYLVNDLKDYTGNRTPPPFPYVSTTQDDDSLESEISKLFSPGEKGKNREQGSGRIV